MKTTKVELKEASFFVKTPVIDVKFDIIVDHYSYDVKGFIDTRTKEFTPELVGVFGIHQFATEIAKTDVESFVEELKKIVSKELK